MTAPDTLPPELAELGELLREDPPRPDAKWARNLDARAAAGFARPPRRSPWAVLKPARRFLVPAVSFACVALLVVGIASLPSSSDDSGSGSVSAGGGGSMSTAESSGDTVERSSRPPAAADSAGGSPGSDGRSRRYQVRNAQLTLATRPRDVEKVAAGVLRVADVSGGFVASSTVSDEGGTFELRIPTARLNRALADLSKLGKVRSRTQSSEDITAETVSTRGRLREAQREREGLLRALANATTLNETESVKARLRTVNDRIATLRAAVRRVANRASYANVSVELVSDRSGAAPIGDDGRWTPGDAFRDAVRVLEVAAGIALIVLALLLPLALLGGIGALASRGLGHRRRERALDMA